MKGSRKRKRKDVSDPPIGGVECKPHQYDVFINHRGPDVKKTFVAHLDDALRRDGFRPFLDAKDIGQGCHVFKSIDEALNGACVHVAIFSKRYAESKYCLNELCDMLKSKQVILPVFYHVNAEDLKRVENGLFKEGFEKHIKRGRKEEVEKWKEALGKVADFRGFRLDEVNGNEMELIRRILVEVQNAMPATLLPAEECYGMETSMKDVLKRLKSLRVVGLVGVGGIGKTTLAMEIYNHFVSRRQFDRHCFLRDVRSSEPSQLQHDLLRDLGHGSELQSTRPQDYKRMFDGLISQKVLVVVDDIDDSSQFKALIPDIQKFGSGSRILITSRQQDVLKRAMAAAPSHEVYDVPRLNECDSWRLFNHHAFRSETPSEGFAELAVKVADAFGGLALLLETTGASLLGEKDREVWLDSVKSLQENEAIFGKLRSTYDRLPTEGDRAMFRDIACMLIGVEKEVALTIWKSCSSCSRAHCTTSRTPALTLRRLMNWSLVKVDYGGGLRMHDVLRDMGRNFAKEEAQGSSEWTHLWDAASAAKALGYRKMNTSTRGMSLAVMADTIDSFSYGPNIKDGAVSCEVSDLMSMKELHLLVLDGCDVVVPDGFSSWPQQLRWLQWKLCCFASLPSHFNLPNLVVLDLSWSIKLTRLWKNDAHVQLPLLQTLDLSWCGMLEELPENVGKGLPKLKSMVMLRCSKLRGLPDSIGQLMGLEHLDLHGCVELVSLPDVIVGLVSLRTLILYECSKLQQLPEELGNLTNLETLDVFYCSSLSKLPGSIGGLRMLKRLNMYGTMVEDRPAGFGLLTSLTSFSTKGLRCVPESFQRLQSLTSLWLSKVSVDLGDLGALAALTNIEFSEHATITILPKSLGNLKQLVSLIMRDCPKLLTVEALPEGLGDLDLTGCPKLIKIPSLAAMRCLEYLYLKDCESLRHVNGLECVTTLKGLDVSGCTLMEGFIINGMVNSALCRCDVSESEVGVAYNNRWLEREPADQVISWFGDSIAPLSNSMAKEHFLLGGFKGLTLQPNRWTLVLEASISSTGECMALICSLAINPSGWDCGCCCELKVKVWRGGQLVIKSKVFQTIYLRNCNQVHLYTLRREHEVVSPLQLGDQICIYLKPHVADEEKGSFAVVGRGVCVVHNNEDEKLVLAMNSEELSTSQSEDLAMQFSQLVLENKWEEDEWEEDDCEEEDAEEDDCDELIPAYSEG